MPGNEAGDRVHNFFAQDNLSEGQHSQVVNANWPSLSNNPWNGSQNEIAVPSANPKNYNPLQSETERGQFNHHLQVPHGLNFTQKSQRADFGQPQSQGQPGNLNGYMYGRQNIPSRQEVANFMGADTESDQNNVSHRGFSMYESQQEGVPGHMAKSAMKSDSSNAPLTFDLFGGQQQMNGQFQGFPPAAPQQQPGYSDMQQLQQQLLLRKMQELQRQNQLRQLDARQNSVNQMSSFTRQAAGSHSPLINGTPVSNASNYHLFGSSSGLPFSSDQGQSGLPTGFVNQQVSQSLYGFPVSGSRGNINHFPQMETDTISVQQRPTYSNSFAHNQYAVSPEEVQGRNFLGQVSGQGSDMSGQDNVSAQEFHGSQDVSGSADMLVEKTAGETTSHNSASLDPAEERILFGSDDNIWDAFGGETNMSGGTSNLLDGSGYMNGLPSVQSGSWSALMQSAVAETSGNDTGVQEEFTGLSFHSSQVPANGQLSKYDISEKKHIDLSKDNLHASLSFASTPLLNGANVVDNYHSVTGFQHHGNKMSSEHGGTPQIISSGIQSQQSSRAMHYNRGSLQKPHFDGSEVYENASQDVNSKNISNRWNSPQYEPRQPSNRPNDWNPVESVQATRNSALYSNENKNTLQQSQVNDRKRAHGEIGHDDGTMKINLLHNPNAESESSMGNLLMNREGFTMNNTAVRPSSGATQVGLDSNQYLQSGNQPNYWKHVDSTVKSKGSDQLEKFQRHLNKSSDVSDSSLNGFDNDELKMHEMESSSKKAGGNQSLSGQAGRKPSGPPKFQYHPMGNLDEDGERPYGMRQAAHPQAMSQQHSQGLKGQDQGYFGQPSFFGHVPKTSTEVGKRHLASFKGDSNGARPRSFFPGHSPDMFAQFNGSVGLSESSQTSQNMLELLHKVDRSREHGAMSPFSPSDLNPSPEMPEPEKSDGSVGGLHRSQSSNSQGFALQLAPPSQRMPGPIHTSQSAAPTVNNSNSSTHVSPDVRDKGRVLLSPSHSVSFPPSQETTLGEFKTETGVIPSFNVSGDLAQKMAGNFSQQSGSGFPSSRSQVQNQSRNGPSGQVFTSHSGRESYDRQSPHIRQTDNSCNALVSSQSAAHSSSKAAGCGLYDNVPFNASRPNTGSILQDRVQPQSHSGAEKFPVAQPSHNSALSQHGAFSKISPNLWTNVPPQHFLGTKFNNVHSNLSHSHQLNIVESSSSALQNLEDQNTEHGESLPSKYTSGSRNVELVQKNKSEGNEITVNTASTQQDLEAFGRSLKPNNFQESYSLLNQMRAMKNPDIDPCNREMKRMKVPDKFLGSQNQAPWAGQLNERELIVGDKSSVPSGENKRISFSGPADTIAKDVSSHQGNMPAFDQTSQSYNNNSGVASVKDEHRHISPQMAPTWFKLYGNFKNGQIMPLNDSQNAASLVAPFNLEKSSGSLEAHSSERQVKTAADSSQEGVICHNSAPPSAMIELASPSLGVDVGVQDFICPGPSKRNTATSDLQPWHKEVSQGSQNISTVSMAAAEWAKAANYLIEKVEGDGEVIEDMSPFSRPKRRLILTTQLMQQLLRPPPTSVTCADARSNYESMIYFAARLALGEACSLASSSSRDSNVPQSETNLSKPSARIEDRHLSKVMEDLMAKARNLENDLLRLDKRTSVLDLRMEGQDLERFSVINRFAKFHGGRNYQDGAETSSSDALLNAPKSAPHRYVTAVPFPKNLPDRVQCISL